ncbi:MAG: hypothetical protein ABR598_01530 [Candidatus Dormibacteria bacterium]
MSTDHVVQANGRAGARAIAAGVLVGLSVFELGALVLPMPSPVVVVSLVLIPLGVAAAVALWLGRGWGKPLGITVSVVSAVKGTLGVVLASSMVTRGGAGLIAALGVVGCAFLLMPGDQGEA